MQYVANDCVVVGIDSFTQKDGKVRYSVLLANGSGQPHKVSCTVEQAGVIVPLSKKYDVVVNIDTVGYNSYSDLVEIFEK